MAIHLEELQKDGEWLVLEVYFTNDMYDLILYKCDLTQIDKIDKKDGSNSCYLRFIISPIIISILDLTPQSIEEIISHDLDLIINENIDEEIFYEHVKKISASLYAGVIEIHNIENIYPSPICSPKQ